MTRAEILALEGRDLDRAVAELMGDSVPPGTFWMPFPAYSSDMNAAWTVAEKFRLSVVPVVNGGWASSPNDYVYDPAFFLAPTAPIAICRAALLMHPTEEEKKG